MGNQASLSTASSSSGSWEDDLSDDDDHFTDDMAIHQTDDNHYVDAITHIPVIFAPACVAHMAAVRASRKMADYLATLDDTVMECHHIDVENVKMFGPAVGFIYATAALVQPGTRKPIPGIVHITGPSAAVLIVLHVAAPGDDPQTVLMLVEQRRGPTGTRATELLAGMADEDGCLGGVAIKEAREETGMVIPNVADMIPLRSYWASPGRTSEWIDLFAWVQDLTQDAYSQLIRRTAGRQLGVGDESITVKFIDYQPHMDLAVYEDAKLEVAFARYQEFCWRNGRAL